MPTALIWGASGGIGSALVQTLKAQQWTVYAAARTLQNIPPVADETFKFDATQPESFKEVALLLAQDNVSLDLVIYAAGAMHPSTLENLGAHGWQQLMDVNLHGAFLGIQSILHLVAKGGHIMVLGAYTEKITLPKFGAYVAAKAALAPMMTIFSKENRRKNFTLVRLPSVNTPFWQNIPFTMPEYALAPQVVADAILQHYHANGADELNL